MTEHAVNPHSPYALLGGEEGIKQLSAAFYRAMDESQEAANIRAMHGTDLGDIEQKLFEYLSGWFGGPHLYREKYQTVCLTSPHKGYHIDAKARDEWLFCMNKALEEVGASAQVKQMLEKPLFDLADFIRND